MQLVTTTACSSRNSNSTLSLSLTSLLARWKGAGRQAGSLRKAMLAFFLNQERIIVKGESISTVSTTTSTVALTYMTITMIPLPNV